MTPTNTELTQAGFDWLNSSYRHLLQIAKVNFWEWDLSSNEIIEFGHHPSLSCTKDHTINGYFENFLSKVHPEDVDYVISRINQAINSKSNPDYYAEFRVLKNDGCYEHILSRGKALSHGPGKPYKMVGIWFSIDDLTKSKETERLQQAAMARFTRSTSIGEMASLMSHELTQPLAVSSMYLNGCIDRLTRDNINKHELIEALSKASDHLHLTGNIIHKIKNFIRRGELIKETISLRSVLESAIKLTEISYDFPVNVRVSEPHNIPNINIDKLQIMQVLLNILNNSYDAFIEYNTVKPTININIKKQN